MTEIIYRIPDHEVDKQLSIGRQIEERYHSITSVDKPSEEQMIAFVKYVFNNVDTLDFGQKTFTEKAFFILNTLVNKYYPPAQFYLGTILITGIPGFNRKKPDYVRAFSLFYLAATKGHVDAMYHVALCYQFGRGVGEVDAPRAIKWFKRAAEEKHPGALYKLSQTGRKRNLGLKLSEKDSFKYMLESGKRSDYKYNKATFRLAKFYERLGETVNAKKWLLIGYKLGQRDCIAELGFYHLRKDKSNLFPSDLDLATKYFENAKKRGSAGACYGLSLVYLLKNDINGAFVSAMDASARGDYRGDYIAGYLGLRYGPKKEAIESTGLNLIPGVEQSSINETSIDINHLSNIYENHSLKDRDIEPIISISKLRGQTKYPNVVPDIKILLPKPIDYIKKAYQEGKDPYAEYFLHNLSAAYAPGVNPLRYGSNNNLPIDLSDTHTLLSPLQRRDIHVLEDEVDWAELGALTSGEEILLKDAEFSFALAEHVV